MANQQNAVFVHGIGQPVKLGTRIIPKPKEGEALVKVSSTMLLPHDAYGRDWGLFIAEKLPYVLGSNVAGVVQEVGPGVTNVNPGDRVFGMSNYRSLAPDQAGLQQYAIQDANAIGKTPLGFTDDQVATLPVNLVTTFISLFTGNGFGFPPPFPGAASSFDYQAQSLVIIAAGSNSGKFAVQLAKLAGIGNIIAIAASTNQKEMGEMGATHFLDRHLTQSQIAAEVHNITGPQGAIAVLDCYSDKFELARAILPSEAPSKLRSLHPIEGEEQEKFRVERPHCDAGFVDASNEQLEPNVREFWEAVPLWLQSGSIKPRPFRVIEGLSKVDAINAVLDAYSAGQGGPQAIVHP